MARQLLVQFRRRNHRPQRRIRTSNASFTQNLRKLVLKKRKLKATNEARWRRMYVYVYSTGPVSPLADKFTCNYALRITSIVRVLIEIITLLDYFLRNMRERAREVIHCGPPVIQPHGNVFVCMLRT